MAAPRAARACDHGLPGPPRRALAHDHGDRRRLPPLDCRGRAGPLGDGCGRDCRLARDHGPDRRDRRPAPDRGRLSGRVRRRGRGRARPEPRLLPRRARARRALVRVPAHCRVRGSRGVSAGGARLGGRLRRGGERARVGDRQPGGRRDHGVGLVAPGRARPRRARPGRARRGALCRRDSRRAPADAARAARPRSLGPLLDRVRDDRVRRVDRRAHVPGRLLRRGARRRRGHRRLAACIGRRRRTSSPRAGPGRSRDGGHGGAWSSQPQWRWPSRCRCC